MKFIPTMPEVIKGSIINLGGLLVLALVLANVPTFRDYLKKSGIIN